MLTSGLLAATPALPRRCPRRATRPAADTNLQVGAASVLLRLRQQLPAALNPLREELLQLPGHGGPPIARTRFPSLQWSALAAGAEIDSARTPGDIKSPKRDRYTNLPDRLPLRLLAALRRRQHSVDP
jgi:hypothetical protein